MVTEFEIGKEYRLVSGFGYVTSVGTLKYVGDTFVCDSVDTDGRVWSANGDLLVTLKEYHRFELVEEYNSVEEYIGKWIELKPDSIDNAWNINEKLFLIGKGTKGLWVVWNEDNGYQEIDINVEDIIINKPDTRTKQQKITDTLADNLGISKEKAEWIYNYIKITE